MALVQRRAGLSFVSSLWILLGMFACGDDADGTSTNNPGGGDAGAGGDGSASDASSTTNTDASNTGDAGGLIDLDGEVRAFPGAEGFGAMVTGGRGGKVIKVTTLSASGPGSLQAALDESGPRTIVFAVSGVIAGTGTNNIKITIPHGDVTIAGQTAPGAGITIRGQLFADYDARPSNIIVRHLRVRPVYDGSSATQFDALQFSTADHFILDHVSVSGGADETVDLYEARDATVQWSTIESSAEVIQSGDTTPHNYGLINGPDGARLSVHHTLFAHHRVRSPAIANGPAEIIHNVVYNGLRGFVHNNPATGAFNFIGNTFVDGPVQKLAAFYFDPENGVDGTLGYFLSQNEARGAEASCTPGPVDDPWTTCDIDQDVPSTTKRATRFAFTGDAFREVRAGATTARYDAVTAHAGAFPRDFIAKRSVAELAAGTGAHGIRYTNASDFLEGLTVGTAPVDADNDGIADAWETNHGLSASNAADGATIMPGGYSALETYLAELAAGLLPP
jgi:pectate lyase